MGRKEKGLWPEFQCLDVYVRNQTSTVAGLCHSKMDGKRCETAWDAFLGFYSVEKNKS
jgi:hypothetical protein